MNGRWIVWMTLTMLMLAPAAPRSWAQRRAVRRTAAPAKAAADDADAANGNGDQAESSPEATAKPSHRRSVSGAAPGDSRLRVRIPSDARVESVSVVMEGTEGTRVEDQSSERPDTLLTIGHVRERTVGFDEGKVKQKGENENKEAVFYVYSGVERLSEFEITPIFFKSGEDVSDSGQTPPIFRVEVLFLDRIGDTDGDVAKTVEDVALHVGRPNRVELNVRVPAGKKVGIRMSIPPEKAGREELFVQVKAARKGHYPANTVIGRGDTYVSTGVLFEPAVSFVYAARMGDIDTFNDPKEGLVAQINRYLSDHRGEGSVEIPLRLRVQYR